MNETLNVIGLMALIIVPMAIAGKMDHDDANAQLCAKRLHPYGLSDAAYKDAMEACLKGLE